MKKFFLLFLISGLFLYSSVYSQWDTLYKGLNGIVLAWAVNGNNIFAGTNEGIYLSTDHGDNWIQKNNGLTGNAINSCCFAISGNKIFSGAKSSGAKEGIFLSMDNGDNWLSKPFDSTGIVIQCIAVNGNNIFVGTQNNGILFSTNNGDKWTAKNQGLTNLNVQKIIIKDNFILAGTAGGGIFKSIDNGTTWIISNKGLSELSITSFEVNGNDIYVSTWFGGIFLSTNNGDSWSPKNNGINHLDIMSIVLSKNYLFAISSLHGLFYSQDKGENWISKNNGLEDFEFRSIETDSDYIFAIVYGPFLYRSKINNIIISDISENKFKFNLDLNIFPNPSTDNISISLNNGACSIANISIFNSIGIEVKRFYEKELLGKSSIIVSTKEFSSGMYYCVMNTGSNKVTKSFVVVK